MFLPISEAAKKAGLARSTLYKMRDAGKISFSKSSTGALGIEFAELARVFPNVSTSASHQSTPEKIVDNQNQLLEQENVHLRDTIKRLERELEHHQQKELKSDERLDTLLAVTREQSKQLLLTHDTSTAKEKKSFWQRWKDSS